MRIENSSWKFALVLVFLLVAGCEREASTTTEPGRPPNIPASSIWVGGLDGGVFVLVRKSEQLGKDMYFGEVYYVSGDVAYKGPLKIFPARTVDFDPTKKESYEGWDGDTLYLKNGRHLKVQE